MDEFKNDLIFGPIGTFFISILMWKIIHPTFLGPHADTRLIQGGPFHDQGSHQNIPIIKPTRTFFVSTTTTKSSIKPFRFAIFLTL